VKSNILLFDTSYNYMNAFEQYTVIIGILAILFESISYLRAFFRKMIHW